MLSSYAISYRSAEAAADESLMIDQLLAAGLTAQDLKNPKKTGRRHLIHALAETNNVAAITRLIEIGFTERDLMTESYCKSIEDFNGYSTTNNAVIIAATKGNVEVLKCLKSKVPMFLNKHIMSRNQTGDNLLHYAAKKADFPLMEFFVEALEKEAKSSLDPQYRGKSEELFRSNLLQTNGIGQSAFQIASQNAATSLDCAKIAALLQSKGANIEPVALRIPSLPIFDVPLIAVPDTSPQVFSAATRLNQLGNSLAAAGQITP